MTDPSTQPLVELKDASLSFGDRTLFKELTLSVQRGEFLAVLGPNGSGKSSLIKTLLGIYKLNAGEMHVGGSVGYIPQQRAFDDSFPVRGRDLVRFGLDGAKWGFTPASPDVHFRVEAVIDEVGARDFADAQVGRLSGGEQQRLRIAQALVGQSEILLCDEPLLSLDLASQKAVGELIEKRRRQGSAVIFVTHEINPILPYVDHLLYLVGGKWKLGTPEEVLTSESLTALYGTDVDVLHVRNRIIVVTSEEAMPTEPTDQHHHLANGAHE
jgi:zinc/manganese transport system ATP-binding protein